MVEFRKPLFLKVLGRLSAAARPPQCPLGPVTVCSLLSGFIFYRSCDLHELQVVGEGKAHQFHTHFVNPWLPLGFLRKGHVPSLFRSCLYYSKIQNVPSIAPQSYFVYFMMCIFYHPCRRC